MQRVHFSVERPFKYTVSRPGRLRWKLTGLLCEGGGVICEFLYQGLLFHYFTGPYNVCPAKRLFAKRNKSNTSYGMNVLKRVEVRMFTIFILATNILNDMMTNAHIGDFTN